MINESIKLERIGNSSYLEFKFLNGSIYMDESKYGAYALSPGCGSGKTTIVKQLIKMKWHEGILYSAFTRDECNEMYKWIKENLIGTRNETTGEVLTYKDILVLHSDYTADGTDKDLWMNRPEEVADKRIVICTHSKLLDEPLCLLVNSNFNMTLSQVYGPTKASSMNSGNGRLPRQWLLIDEITEANQVKFTVPRSIAGTLGQVSNITQEIIDDPNNPNGKICYLRQLDKPRFVRADNFYYVFKGKAELAASYFPEQFSMLPKTSKCRLDELRKEQFCESIFNNFDRIAESNNQYVKLSYSYADLISSKMNTKLILLDGTSDITMTTSKKFQVLPIQNNNNNERYNSKVSISLFSFYGLDRKVKADKSIPNIDFYIKDKIENIVDQLETIIRSNEKTLIFTWMDLKSDETEINDDEDFTQSNTSADVKEIKLVDESRLAIVNPNQYFYKYIQHKLEDRGLVHGVNFSIEYYGSGKDKAVNEYRDYDAVVLAGNYRVPNSVISDFNLMFGTNITGTEYYANRAIQAICRTRIRKHEGEAINVYISSDWSGDTINYIKRYLKIDKVEGQISAENVANVSYMYNELRKIGISPKKAEQIAKLSTLDQNIFRAITSKVMYSTSLRLNDIYEIIPMTVKEVHKYRRILSSLLDYGVKLNIIK